MKNKIFIINFFLALCFLTNLFAKDLEISSSEIKLDKKNSKIIFKGSIKAVDESNNVLKAEEANYSKKFDLLNSVGSTTIITSENYTLKSKNVIFDNKNKIIKSDYPTEIVDPDGNIIFVNMFNYNSLKNILFSKGEIKLEDKKKNVYKFRELYINEKKEKNYRFRCKNFFKRQQLKS